jgi:hypothetical protein
VFLKDVLQFLKRSHPETLTQVVPLIGKYRKIHANLDPAAIDVEAMFAEWYTLQFVCLTTTIDEQSSFCYVSFLVYVFPSLNEQIERFLEENPGGDFQAYRMNQPQHINGPSR